MAIRRLAIGFLAATLFASANSKHTTADAAEQVVFTQLLHRHGARSPLPPANQSRWCSASGCGTLNDQGKDMLFHLGYFIRNRYEVLNPSYFPTTVYDPSLISSRSTDFSRTILSAECMLHGLFPNTTAPFLPYVTTVPADTDILLSSNALMSYAQRLIWLSNTHALDTILLPSAIRIFGGDPNTNATVADFIATMAAEVSLQGFCEAGGFATCLGYIQDIIVSLIAQGQGNVAPVGNAYVGQLTDFLHDINVVFYGYNLNTTGEDGDTPADVKARGSCGQPLAQQMLDNIDAFISGHALFKFMHYSAHDSTITPFAVTIGDPDLYATGYGTFVLIDLVEDAGSYYVRGIKGAPGQTPANHTYWSAFLKLGGIDANGNVYHLTDDTDRMPLEDFVRFVDSTVATSSEGYCVLTPTVSQYMDCGLQSNAPTRSCFDYRSNCPTYGCPSNAYLMLPAYTCAVLPNTPTPGNDDDDKDRIKIAILAASVVGAVLIGFAAGFAVNSCRRNKRSGKAQEYNSLIS